MSRSVKSLLAKKSGILLDIGCGTNKQKGFIGMDRRKLPGVDIVHDLESFPYPLPDNACLSIVGIHIVEHIKPWKMIEFMNELWRITQPNGQLYFVMPYSVNDLYVQDPTHCNPCNENTWKYFDPRYEHYQFYTPKPWLLDPAPRWQASGLMEVIFRKATDAKMGKDRKG